MPTQASSDPSAIQQGSVCSTLTPSLRINFLRPRSAIAGSRPQNKKTISLDRSSTCSSSSQAQKSLKTLEAASTSNAKDLSPYWTDWHLVKSSQLWLPTRTDWRGSGLKSSSTLSVGMVVNSWFLSEVSTAPSENFATIFSPSFTSSLAECTGSEGTLVKSKKIRLYPTPEQASIFKRWIGIGRVAFNAAVEVLREPGSKAAWKSIKTAIIYGLPDWSEQAPYQVRSIAIRDACKAVTAAKKKCLSTCEVQRVSFRTRKSPIQSCYIPKTAIGKKGGIYPQLCPGAVKLAEQMPDEFQDLRLVCANGRWYLVVPTKQKRRVTENQGRVVALDPGIRTFQTFYAQDCCGKLGEGDFSRIQRMCSELDQLTSRRKREKRRFAAKHLSQACKRLRLRIRDLVDELHHKVARFLVTNFDVIVLPTFDSSDMVKRGARKLRAKSVRSLLSFAHYRFKSFLKHKAFEFGKLVLDQNEAWTSKTASWTGEVISNLGGRRSIRSGGVTLDRDVNGARGIFLRALGDQPILRENLRDASAASLPMVTSASEN